MEKLISGYATVNGTPVSEGFFANNRLNTYLQPADRIVVNNGYFEVVQKWNTSSVWILHCALNGVTNGVVAEFTNLMLEEGNKASAYTKNPNDTDEVIGTKANTADVYKRYGIDLYRFRELKFSNSKNIERDIRRKIKNEGNQN